MNFLVRQDYQRTVDGYINATQLCQQANKRWSNYFQNSSTKEFLKVLSTVTGIPVTGLVQTSQGGSPENQGTWIHPDIAINLGQWISPEFAVMVSGWVREWLSTGKNPLDSSQQSVQVTLAQIETIFAGLHKLPIKSELIESAKLSAIARTFPTLAPGVEEAKRLLSAQMTVAETSKSPTEIGILIAKKLGLEVIPSAKKVNQVLREKGLQTGDYTINRRGRKRLEYQLTEKGENYGQMQLEQSTHGSKTLVCVRWFSSVVNVISDRF